VSPSVTALAAYLQFKATLDCNLISRSSIIDKGLKVYCFTGNKGGNVAKICKCLRVPSDITARIQEAHITIGHIICEIVESQVFNKK